ncbi:MAG: hypothetical protein HYX48_01245 [Chlamydiales bacterium]|nr:hypothetical protein [Chlamydiales bacterium]
MKRFKFFATAGSAALILFGFVWVALLSRSQPLPTAETPLLLYSNQSRDNLHALFAQAIREAKSSLHISMYALTDPELLALLRQQAKKGVSTTLFYDPSATSKPPDSENFYAFPIKLPGALMHRKILIVDEERVFIGSANFTTTSLKIHDNLVAGILNPQLAHFLTRCDREIFPFFTGEAAGELWLLPSQEALERTLELLNQAKKSIYVAMFTLTHPELTRALIEAHARGVDVRVAVDHYTAEGASLPMLKALQNAGVPLYLSAGQQLFHHKWALIDSSTLLLGSANWTQAAFARNQDCFLVLPALSQKQLSQIQKIWKIIELESQ